MPLQERLALEHMRVDFEAELQAARSEVARAQEALGGAEERVRAAEALERQRMEAEYQSRLQAMAMQVDRLKEELAYRTATMTEEMSR